MESETHALKEAIREFALKMPEAYEDFPWGESVIKVNKKIFVFLGLDTDLEKGFNFLVKLPVSSGMVLQLPHTQPSGYKLGKSGWVTVHCLPGELPLLELCQCWIEESYRAVAPKKLLAQLENLASNQTAQAN